MRSIFSIIIIGLLTACSTINYIGIETYNPAEITFPEPVKKILVVNNAVPQPPESGYTYKLRGVPQDTCKAVADSALFEACRGLGESIMEKDYFEDVLLYHLPTRTDDAYYSDKKLTPEQVSRLCLENGTDAIISFDRLLFLMEKDISLVWDGFIGTIEVKMGGIVRTYLPERENPLATILVYDSIYIAEVAPNLEPLEKFFLPTPEKALRETASRLSREIYPNFVPFWMEERRWYYKGGNTQWKEASAFAAAGKWENAWQHWNNIHSKTNSWKEKAKTASNIALYYEINQNLTEALKWATLSYELFLKNKGEEAEETQRQQDYVEALQKRQQKDMKLDIQFGKQ